MEFMVCLKMCIRDRTLRAYVLALSFSVISAMNLPIADDDEETNDDI